MSFFGLWMLLLLQLASLLEAFPSQQRQQSQMQWAAWKDTPNGSWPFASANTDTNRRTSTTSLRQRTFGFPRRRLGRTLQSSITDMGSTAAQGGYVPIEDELDSLVGIDQGHNDHHKGDEDDSKQRRLIEIESQIELPFSAEVAYEAYSNLPRQPTWSSWLESVVVLNDDDNSSNGDSHNNNHNEKKKVESKWTSKILGIRYSWTAEAIRNDRPHTIQWRSVTGLRNEGIVRFHRKAGKNYDEGPTLMTLKMAFVTPRAVASILKRSKKLSKFVKENMIEESLREFRDVVLEHDVPRSSSN